MYTMCSFLLPYLMLDSLLNGFVIYIIRQGLKLFIVSQFHTLFLYLYIHCILYILLHKDITSQDNGSPDQLVYTCSLIIDFAVCLQNNLML